MGSLIVAAACVALPALVWIQYQLGIADAIDQMITYGQRETARTQLAAQRFVVASFADLASATNAAVFLSYLVRVIPLAGAWVAPAWRSPEPAA